MLATSALSSFKTHRHTNTYDAYYFVSLLCIILVLVIVGFLIFLPKKKNKLDNDGDRFVNLNEDESESRRANEVRWADQQDQLELEALVFRNMHKLGIKSTPMKARLYAAIQKQKDIDDLNRLNKNPPKQLEPQAMPKKELKIGPLKKVKRMEKPLRRLHKSGSHHKTTLKHAKKKKSSSKHGGHKKAKK